MKKNDEQKLTVIKIPGMPYLRIVSGTGINNRFTRHVHSHICIGLVRAGSRTMSFVGEQVTYRKNDLFIINPGEPHTCAIRSGSHSYTVLTIDPAFVEWTTNSRLCNICVCSDRLYLLFRKLITTIGGSSPLLEKESAFFSFMETVFLLCSTENREELISSWHKSVIKKIREHLDNNLNEKISLAELSDVAGLSQFHLNRLFCSITGLSPYSYHLHARIEHAKHMLLQGRPIIETALDSGFTDQSHFSRYFKKIVGVTPGVFIRHNMQNN